MFKMRFKVSYFSFHNLFNCLPHHPNVAVRITEKEIDRSIDVLIEIPGDLRQSTYLFLPFCFSNRTVTWGWGGVEW